MCIGRPAEMILVARRLLNPPRRVSRGRQEGRGAMDDIHISLAGILYIALVILVVGFGAGVLITRGTIDEAPAPEIDMKETYEAVNARTGGLADSLRLGQPIHSCSLRRHFLDIRN